MTSGVLNRFLLGLGLIIPVALQIQYDFFSSPTYIGLRLNLADLMVPVAGLGIALSLLLKKSAWPAISQDWPWLAALTGIMTFALFTGYWRNGDWNQWGLMNKYAGWWLLMALLLWGAWLRTNTTAEYLTSLLKITAWSGALIMICGILVLLLRDHATLPAEGIFSYPLAGLMANRNSYALWLCCLSVLIGVFQRYNQPLLPHGMAVSFWLLLPLAHILIGSRAGWIVQALIFLPLMPYVGRRAWGPALVGIGLVFLLAAANFVTVSREWQFYLFENLSRVVQDDTLSYEKTGSQPYEQLSDVYRMKAAHDALALWKTAPIAGAGLGSFLIYQKELYGELKDVIDNSPLWLLTETGLLGLLVFSGFYTVCLYWLWRSSHPLSKSMIGILLAFGIFALFHEIIYTRFIWFFLGLSLASERILADQRAESIDVQDRGT